MTQRPSGWYDDPHDETQLRYWDGILWSERTTPKLMPGLDHVGQARPPKPPEAPAPRRDGEPRSYQAHWGPEEPERRHSFDASQFAGADRHYAPLVGTAGMPSGLLRRIVAYFVDRFVVGFVVTLLSIPFLGEWMNRMQAYIDEVMTASRSGAQIPELPEVASQPPLALSAALATAMLVYDVLFVRWGGGRTLGKRLLDIQVVVADAAPPSPAMPTVQAEAGPVQESGGAGASVMAATTQVPLSRSVLRAAVKWAADFLGLVTALASFAALFQLVVLAWALGNVKRQGLHDLAARTVVRRMP